MIAADIDSGRYLLRVSLPVASLAAPSSVARSWQDLEEVPFVGKRLADKIVEIVSSGGLRQLEQVDKEKEAVISLFKNTHGIGQITAHKFYAQVGHLQCVLPAI